MVNKFLYPNGGSETYIFKLGAYLQTQGHDVQYFGMEHEDRCVGNRVNMYTSVMDFHGGSKLTKLTYPFKTIYSTEARKKIGLVLDDFQPDVVHLNNFNYQLTPSIILEIVKWRRQEKKECRIVFTAHDYQLLCPNHQLHNPNTHENCVKCLGGQFINCVKGKCIHGSIAKSVVGTAEAYFWKWKGVYKYIDSIICPSEFMKQKMDTNPLFAKKTVAIHNFVDEPETLEPFATEKKEYVLYFGRFSEEKGMATLIKVCKELSDIHFIFAGTGSLEKELKEMKNVECVGFKTGEELNTLVRNARFSVFPSEWYETYGLSVAESLSLGTPVIGSDIGGIPEIIRDGVDGKLFESGNKDDLKDKISFLWNNPDELERLTTECLKEKQGSIVQYYGKIIPVYTGGVSR